MTTNTIGVRYENGKRVATQEVSYEKSDDLFTLANLCRQHENIIAQIESATIDGIDTTRLLERKADLETQISTQESYINGFDTASEV